MYSFGYGYFGQLGHNNQETISIPKKIDGLANIIQIACGEVSNFLSKFIPFVIC